MKSLTWKQTIKLGKKVVTDRLRELGIKFDVKEQYFRLCSLLYKADKQMGQVIDIAKKRIDKAKKAVEESASTLDFIHARADLARAEITALMF